MSDTAAKFRRALVLAGAVWVATMTNARADRITYDGQTWDNVLIYQSSTMYYVKVPDDGTIFNVPINAVPSSNVIINRDPYYRDGLRKRFDENTAGQRRVSSDGIGASAFNVPTSAPGDAAPAAEAAPAPADPMEGIRSALGNFGFTFSDEGTDLVAKSPDGATAIRFVGGTPAGGVDYISTLPEAQAGQQVIALNMLGGMAAQQAPWAESFLQQEVAPLLQTGGTVEKSDGPLSIKAEVTKADGNVTLHITAMPVAV